MWEDLQILSLHSSRTANKGYKPPITVWVDAITMTSSPLDGLSIDFIWLCTIKLESKGLFLNFHD